MNPLDKLELFAFARKLNEEMPIHTETTAKIKRSFSQGMPKNLMEYSAFVDNHFLNDNLAIIEEMQHRNKSHPIPKWFRQYQLRHYAKYGILKGDHFFGAKLGIIPDLGEHRGIGFLPYAGITLGFGTIGDTKVFGSDLIFGGTSSGSDGGGASGLILLVKNTGAVIGEYYDRIAIDYVVVSGNNRLAVYDNSGSDPNAILSETGSLAVIGSFGWNTLTEFPITTTTVWAGFQVDNNTAAINYQSGIRSFKAQAYGAFTTGGFTTNSSVAERHHKIGHTP